MADALRSYASCCTQKTLPHDGKDKTKATPLWCASGRAPARPSALRPVCSVASFNDFAASSFPGGTGGRGKRITHSERDVEQSEQQLREFLRGGEDVASIMTQMANLLEDIQGFEDREEALAVEMAAAAAVAGRLEILDRNFLLALDYMMHEASKIRDDKQVWLLQTLKQQVLVQLESRFPPQVEVVSLLVTTPKREERLDILRRAAAAASYGANKPKLEQQAENAASERNQKEQALNGHAYSGTAARPAGDEVTPALQPEEHVGPMAHQRLSSPEVSGLQDPSSAATVNSTLRYTGDEDPESVAAAAAWWEESKGEGDGEGGSGEMEAEAPKVKRRVPAATLSHIIAQADDLIAFMEEELPIRDRRLLARLVLAREEARGMMSGGFLDPRNDVRKLQNLPEAEVRFISQLAAIRAPQQLKQRLLEVLRGEGEGEHQPQQDGKPRMAYGAPVRPGHFMDSVTKVIAGIYKTGGSGVVVQQLERIRKESLEALQEIGHL